MANNELLNKIEELNSWEQLMEEARAEAEALRDSIKQEMLERDTEELECGQYIIRWTSVLTQRFDTTSPSSSRVLPNGSPSREMNREGGRNTKPAPAKRREKRK